MTRSWYAAAVWSGVAAALVGFVLPWARLDLGTSKSSRELSAAALLAALPARAARTPR